MASEAASSTQDKTESQEDQNKKVSGPMVAKLQDFLKKYQSNLETSQVDTLKNRYVIDLTQPLPDFNTQQARAYVATDTSEEGRSLYAHVCDWGRTQRYRVIAQLKAVENRILVPIVAVGNVKLSTTQEERFVIVYERPAGIRLSELIKRRKIPLNTTFITERIIAPIFSVLQQFEDLGMSHGMVNANNIFFTDTAILGPCVSEACGLSQPFYYETPERMQAMPCAKGEGSTTHDYYALAVVLLEIVHGDEHLAHFTKDSLIMAILRQGAYNTLMRDKDVPEVFYDFFRGAFTLTSDDRWYSMQIVAWLGGKRFNVLPPPTPVDAVRPFEFNDKLANTRRELAQMFCSNWEQMVEALNNNQLAHWVSVSLRNKELSDVVGRLSRSAYDLSSKNAMQTYEAMTNIIMLLDPAGPIRIKQLSMHIDGIDSLFVELYTQKEAPELQIMARLIELNMPNQWLDLRKRAHKEDYVTSAFITAQNVRLDRLRTYIRNAGPGFGLERIMYELNPDMACLSPLLASQNVTSLTDLLIHLDRMATKIPDIDDILDRHISAFVASKLLVIHEIHLDELTGIPALATSKVVLAVYLLGASQLKAPDLKLPGLMNWFALKIIPLLDNIHSRSIRNKSKAAVMALVPTGQIPKLAALIISSDYANNDQMGFEDAFTAFQHNAALIRFYEAADSIEAESAKMGFRIAKVIAYVCLGIVIYLMNKGKL